MKISVVILNWNGKHFLAKFIPPLLESVQSIRGVEIVVADNNSRDDSIEYLQEHFPDSVRVIKLEKNWGFAEGYNKALAEIESDYYVLLNSDVEVTPDWLQVLYDYMEENQDVAACQPKILSYHRRTHFDYAGAAGGFIDKWGYPFCRGRIFHEIEEDRGQYDDVRDIFWASGACMMIRSSEFHGAGGFDGEFFAHQEEIDLCWRLNSRGKRIVCNPQSVVYHIGGGTLDAGSPKKTYYNFRNNLLMLYKNLPAKSLKRTLDVRFYLDNLAAVVELFKFKPKHMRAISAARTDFRKMQPQFADKRKENILNSVRSSFRTIFQGSILYEYHYKRHKVFSAIPDNELIVEQEPEELRNLEKQEE